MAKLVTAITNRVAALVIMVNRGFKCSFWLIKAIALRFRQLVDSYCKLPSIFLPRNSITIQIYSNNNKFVLKANKCDLKAGPGKGRRVKKNFDLILNKLKLS